MIIKRELEFLDKLCGKNNEPPIGFYCSDKRRSKSFYLHWHQNLEIIYITSGKGQLYLDLNFYTIDSSDLIFISKENLHYLISDEEQPLKFELISFNLSLLKDSSPEIQNLINPFYHNNLYFKQIINKEEEGYEIFLKLFKNMRSCLSSKKSGFQLELKGLVYLLFSNMYKFSYVCKYTKNLDSRNNKINILKKVLDYIDDNYKNTIPIKSLANVAGYSEFHFLRFFKLQSKMTCTEFVNLVRIRTASDILLNSNIPISSIAFQVGFSDESYFIKIFKKYFNETPNKFRKNNKL